MLGSVSGNMNFFGKEPQLDFLSRCLPGQLFDKSKSLADLLENHPSIILTVYPGLLYVSFPQKRSILLGSYTVFNIVKVVSALDIKSHRFAVSARLPQNSSNHEGSFLEAQNALKVCSSNALLYLSKRAQTEPFVPRAGSWTTWEFIALGSRKNNFMNLVRLLWKPKQRLVYSCSRLQ